MMPVICLSANTSWYIYNFRASTIKALIAQGFKVICITPEDAYSQKLQTELACTWLNLKMDNQGSNPLKDSHVFLQLLRIYRRYGPVASLHFTIKNNVYGTWAAKLLGIPAINNVSGLGTAFLHAGLVPFIVKGLYKLSFPLASRVFCQNEEDYQLLIEKNLVPQAKLKQLPGSGVNTQRFRPSLRQKPNTMFTFLYAGRMLADKGLFELVDAMDKLIEQGHNCKLDLCGFMDVQNVTAISAEDMAMWCQRDYINYLGSSDSMEHVYASADCVILPSYREGMPRSLLEAGAMALPVVATDVPGCRNIIEHQYNGLLCQVKNVDSLAQTMAQLLLMAPIERSQLGQRGRKKVEQSYSEQLVVDLTLAAINELVNT